MSKLFATIVIITSLNSFAQEIPNRFGDANSPQYVFEFNEKSDNAIYKMVQGVIVITDFEILINKKKILFHSLLPLSNKNEDLKVNITQGQLEDIVRDDNIDKQSRFYIFIKKENKYYSADHLGLRTEIN